MRAPPASIAPRAPTRRLVALATALAGLATIASSLSPDIPARRRILEAVEPGAAHSVAHAVGLLGGVTALWLALGVLRGRQPAVRAAIVLLVVLALVHAVKGLDYEEALLGLAVAAALRRALRPAPEARGPSAVRLAALIALVALVGAYALALTLLLVSGHSPHFGDAIAHAAQALAGAAPVPSGGAWGRTAVHLLIGLAAASTALAVRALLAPARAHDGHPPSDHAAAAALVARHGDDSIAPFALRSDKAFHFAAGGFLAYRTLRETAVVSGDPVGPPGCRAAVMASFLAHARERGWDVVLLGARAEALEGYAELGLRSMQVGLEAVVDPRRFTLDGGASRTVRKAVHRVARHGWTVEVLSGAQLGERVADVLAVEEAWRRGHRRLYGFAMAGDRLWGAPEDATDLYVIARTPAGEARAFQRYVRYGRGLSLDAMRRLDDEPNGIADALVAAALERARELGCEEVSLNFSGFGHLMAAETLERRSHRAARWALRRLHGRFQLERLARFTLKFGPDWRPRYVVYTARTRLPLAALRIMQAEAYLRPRPARPPAGAWLPAAFPVASGSAEVPV